MRIEDIKEKLVELQVDSTYYSLNEGLKSDALILNIFHNNWEVFYMDEKGSKHDELIFNNENEACEYIYNRFKIIKLIKERPIRKVDKDDDLPDIINL